MKHLNPKKKPLVDALAKELSQLAIKEKINLDGHWQLVHWSVNIVFKNNKAQAVARVNARDGYDKISQQLELSFKLAKLQAPVITPLFDKPFYLASGQIVTFWKLLQTKKIVPPQDFMQIIRSNSKIKKLDALKIWQPEIIVEKGKMLLQEGLKEGFCLNLEKQIINNLELWGDRVATILSNGSHLRKLCHADLHAGNVLYQQNQPLLCDLDDICCGPLELELGEILTDYCKRFKKPQYWQQFLRLYQADFDKKLLEAINKLKSVENICWLSSLSSFRLDSRQLLERRLTKSFSNLELYRPPCP